MSVLTFSVPTTAIPLKPTRGLQLTLTALAKICCNDVFIPTSITDLKCLHSDPVLSGSLSLRTVALNVGDFSFKIRPQFIQSGVETLPKHCFFTCEIWLTEREQISHTLNVFMRQPRHKEVECQ